MTQKEIKIVREEVARLDYCINNMQVRFDKVADKRDEGTIMPEMAALRLNDLEAKIIALEWQRVISVCELLGFDYK